jgi:ABC-type branched-subunit amino acid transport system substrate-binding protein
MFPAPTGSGAALAPAAAAAMAAGTDGIIGFIAGGRAGTLLQQLRQLQHHGEYVARALFGHAEMASDADPSSNGALVVGEFPPLGAEAGWFAQFRQDLPVYGVTNPPDEGTTNFWLAARVSQSVAKARGSIDAASMLDAMRERRGPCDRVSPSPRREPGAVPRGLAS